MTPICAISSENEKKERETHKKNFIFDAKNVVFNATKMANILADASFNAKDFVEAAEDWRVYTQFAAQQWEEARGVHGEDGRTFDEKRTLKFNEDDEMFEYRLEVCKARNLGRVFLRIAVRVYGAENIPMTNLMI